MIYGVRSSDAKGADMLGEKLPHPEVSGEVQEATVLIDSEALFIILAKKKASYMQDFEIRRMI